MRCRPVRTGPDRITEENQDVAAQPELHDHPARGGGSVAACHEHGGSGGSRRRGRGAGLEDIAAPRCFEIPVFHDDQHGTAIVVLAVMINALKVVGKELAVADAVADAVRKQA